MSQYRGILKKNKEKIIELFNSGISPKQIGDMFHSCPGPVYKILRNSGIVDSRLMNDGCSMEEHLPLITDLFNNGKHCYEISKIINKCPNTLMTFMKKYNMRTFQNDYTVNDDFFNNIDTPEKAYCLGMWYSDGNVSKDGYYLRIELNSKDIDILNKIKDTIDYTGPIITNYRKDGFSSCTLRICSRKLCNALNNLGCVPKKSLILSFPTSEQVPTELLNHFIRGIFDGDGSIDRRGQCTISGSYNFIYGLKDILPCYYDAIYQGNKKKNKEDSFHQMFIWKKDKAKIFLDWIYAGSTIHMERKRRRYGVLYLDESHDLNNY